MDAFAQTFLVVLYFRIVLLKETLCFLGPCGSKIGPMFTWSFYLLLSQATTHISDILCKQLTVILSIVSAPPAKQWYACHGPKPNAPSSEQW
jgi:hypothetical protein